MSSLSVEPVYSETEPVVMPVAAKTTSRRRGSQTETEEI